MSKDPIQTGEVLVNHVNHRDMHVGLAFFQHTYAILYTLYSGVPEVTLLEVRIREVHRVVFSRKVIRP